MSHLRTFGSLVNVKTHAKRYMKLDSISSQGLFMTYSGTNKKVYVVDEDGSNERLTTHLTYDEAHMSSSKQNLPPMAVTLQQRGYQSDPTTTHSDLSTLKIKLLSTDAHMPIKATENSAGYDIYSSVHTTTPPSSQLLTSTGISLEIPQNHFGMLKSRSDLALKNNIHVQAGVIDADYRGEIKVLLSNQLNDEFTIHPGMRIGQLIIFKLPKLCIEKCDTLSSTTQNDKGFGSTGVDNILPHQQHINTSTSHAAAAKIDAMHSISSDIDNETVAYNVICSDDPFMDFEDIRIPVRGKHPTQGLVMEECPSFTDRVIITGVQPGTSPRCIKNWIRRIKHSHLLKINDQPITSPKQAFSLLSNVVKQHKYFTLRVSQDQRIPIHHDNGLPMLYFDQ